MDVIRIVKNKKVIALFLVAVAVFFVFFYKSPSMEMPERLILVGVRTVEKGNLPVYVQSIGTITPNNSVLVKSRIDGQLIKLHFKEGDLVEEGALLAEIDPKPFEIQVAQARGSYTRDAALLQGAELELDRYKRLYKASSVSLQQLQNQEALVGQYRGMLQISSAALADAERLLSYTKIHAPMSGRLGLRVVDEGNMIRASDSTGLVSLVQDKPLYAIFSLVGKDLAQVQEHFSKKTLRVEALGDGGERVLAEGTLAFLDNQIDSATGTLKAKAIFPSEVEGLYPNQFVTIKLYTYEEENALLVPSSAIQHGEKSLFVFVVEAQKSSEAEAQDASRDAAEGTRRGEVHVREVVLGPSNSGKTVIKSGLSANDIIVTDGVDRLREGTKVLY